MSKNIITAPTDFEGAVGFTGDVTIQNGQLGDLALSETAAKRVAAKKVWQLQQFGYSSESLSNAIGSTIDKHIHTAKGKGTVKRVSVVIEVAPSASGYTYTVDLKKAVDGSTTYNTILSSTLTINDSTAVGTELTLSLDSTKVEYDAKDRFELEVIRSGSSGTEGQGLSVVVHAEETTEAA